nr:MAG TPA: hypothetical protein [Bacteriophage sp.]
MRRTDLTGMEFGKLRATEYAGRDGHGHSLWLCRCACGNETVVPAWRLRSKKTQSCGCSHFANRENRPKPEKPPRKRAERAPAPRAVSPCYNVYCEYRNNIPRGGVWSCTNRKFCPDCQRVRSSEKGDRHA